MQSRKRLNSCRRIVSCEFWRSAPAREAPPHSCSIACLRKKQSTFLPTCRKPCSRNRRKPSAAVHLFATSCWTSNAIRLRKDSLRGNIDIIIAANVVHATRHLRQTLGHIRQLLAPNGMFLLVETTGARRWVDLTFGMTTGWWSFADPEIRTQHPLLNREKWLQLLASEGFSDAEAVGDANGSSCVFEQNLFLAHGPATNSNVAFKEGQSVSRPDTKPAGSWLILGDRGGVASALDRHLRGFGEETVLASALELSTPGSVEGEAKYSALLERAWRKSQTPLRGVIHLMSLDAPGNDSLRPDVLEHAQQFGCESALQLAQATLRRQWTEAPKIWLVTQGAQPIPQSGFSPALVQAPLWGMGKVLALEHPEIWGGLIDLPVNVAAETAATRIAREVFSPDGEDEIAFRGENRTVSRLLPTKSPAPLRPSFKSDASYLITGGLGKIGLILARWMVDNGARSLVLVGRTALADRSTWSSLPAGSSDHDKIRTIQSLERDGAHVYVHAADVSNAESMASLFARFGHDLPPLKGVVHAAAVVETAPIQSASGAAFERAFGPKVRGAWVLHELTSRLDLDFFAMFSSAATVWGSRELAPYAAASTFLDALARFRRTAGLPAATVNWGWWEAGGTSGHVNEFLEMFGLKPMPTPLALDAFGRLLASDRVQTTVASVDWTVFQPIYEAKHQRPFLSALRCRPAESAESTPLADEMFLSQVSAAESEKARDLLENLVRNHVVRVLHLDPREPIDETCGFFKLGMDSIMTVELRGGLQKTSVGNCRRRLLSSTHRSPLSRIICSANLD